jgi:hypothetical protein
VLGEANASGLPMSNGLTRLATRFLGEPQSLEAAHKAIGAKLDAERAAELGLVTFASTTSTGRTRSAFFSRSARVFPRRPHRP